MTVALGSRVGPYEVTARLGEGGMGEVWRATDSRLRREVAIKVLPAVFLADPERLARFEREAQTLAALNHPNIAAIYGLEESDGARALVMELVEGEDLSARIARGAVALDEALAIARQIAEALEAAHEQGIVHRDLKPANAKVRPDGTVKVLDFGLARVMEPVGSTRSAADLARSPTLTSAALARGTQLGVILGTAAYMAPEQARGRPADRRSDVWSFGVVLHEMLAGRPLFAGETVSDVMAAVLTREPDWGALPAATPGPIRRLLRRCLERDPRRRLQAIGEARVALEGPLLADTPAETSSPRRRWAVTGAAIAGAMALFAAGWLLRATTRPDDVPVRMLDLSIPGLEASGTGRSPVLSPDGSRMAFVAEGKLMVRHSARPGAVEVSDGVDALYPFWSPDGGQLAFVREGRVWKVGAEGGQPTEIGAVPVDLTGSGGGVWTSDGRIVLAGSDRVGLWEIPSAGGTGRELLAIDRTTEFDFHEISALPEGRGLIFTVHRSGRVPDLIALLAGGKRRALLEIPGESLRHPVYSPTGHLLYERETTSPGIWAVPFSLASLETTGAPFLAVPAGSVPSVARDGTLAIVRSEQSPLELVRVSRSGAIEPVAELPVGIGHRLSFGLKVSPDGGRVAIVLRGPPSRLAIYDLGRGSLTSVATEIFAVRPVWTSGGERLVYASVREARSANLWTRRADAAGEEERLSTSDELQVPVAVSPDGRWLIYEEGWTADAGGYRKVPLDGSGPAQPLFPGHVWGASASFSPDGRWLAYAAIESGRSEVYVRPFPTGEGRFQLSTGGGNWPVWAGGGEVFYESGGRVYGVAVAPRGDSLTVGKPVPLFRIGSDTQIAPFFDVMPDGQSFLALRSSGRQHVSLILGWPSELARRSR